MKKDFVSITISSSAKDKLSAIANQKHTSLSNAASRIILYHAKHRIDYDETAPDSKVMMDMLRSIHVCVTKNSGSAERTESFIKTLLHQDGAPVPAGYDGAFDNASHSVLADSPQFSVLSALLERLLSNATSAKSFDGTPVMQIRLPVDEFARIRQQYDDLCTSRNS